MIVGHFDSEGGRWYFRIDAPREDVARVARRLFHKAVRVKQARTGHALTRARSAEVAALDALQARHGATAEEWDAAPPSERFVL